jgi:hypothetical protein
MKRLSLIGLLVLLLSAPSCYIARYQQLQKQYEGVQKELSKVRRTNIQLKAEQKTRQDSIVLIQKRTDKLISDAASADSLTKALTMDIRSRLGDEPFGDSVKSAALKSGKAKYMSKEESDIIYWLNLARYQPDLYAEYYIDPWVDLQDEVLWMQSGSTHVFLESFLYYTASCYLEMSSMKSLKMLVPDERCYRSAECHATQSGKTGYVGHDREGCTEYFSGECCYYGSDDGFEVINGLLLDWGVPSLGHREICLGWYDGVGVSIKPHSGYGTNVVLDFE